MTEQNWFGASDASTTDPRLPKSKSTRSPSADGKLRRTIDIVGALALALATTPLLLFGIALVLCTSGQPIFYAQRRVGRHGRIFRCFKLRTMQVGAEEVLAADAELKRRFVQGGFKLRGTEETRLTPVGHWLRVTYLDELPQLWNVLRGDMTLVGPRPVVVEELSQFEPRVERLLAAKPGLFGAWAALGLRRPNYPARAWIELDSLEDRTAVGDLLIAARCCFSLLAGHPDERLAAPSAPDTERHYALSAPKMAEQEA